ncbi:MAG: hypothetical protein V1857_01575 [archaeon]
MPKPKSLLQEEESAVVRALWRLETQTHKPIGLKDLSERVRISSHSFGNAIGTLVSKMVITLKHVRSDELISFTPLGMAILRRLIDDDLEGLCFDSVS